MYSLGRRLWAIIWISGQVEAIQHMFSNGEGLGHYDQGTMYMTMVPWSVVLWCSSQLSHGAPVSYTMVSHSPICASCRNGNRINQNSKSEV